MRAYTLFWKNCFNFSDRTRRKDYWIVALINYVVILAFSFTATQNTTAMGFIGVYMFAILIPSISILVRRLHDIDKSGFWLLIGIIPIIGQIILLVFLLLEGTRGENRFGLDPKAFD